MGATMKFGWIGVLEGLAACDAQADAAYRGEPLFSLRGTVSNDLPEAPEEMEVSLVWLVTAGDDYAVTEGVPVTGDFPAKFSLDVLSPPTEDSLNDYTYGGMYPEEAKVGVAFITVLDPELGMQDDSMLGIAEQHVLVYVDRDVVPGSWSEEFLGGALSAGFHLMAVDPWTEEEEAACLELNPEGDCFEFDALSPVDPETEIPVRLDDPDNLYIPNWT